MISKNKFTKVSALIVIVLLLCFAAIVCVGCKPEDGSPDTNGNIKNVILFIGDGMGPQQVKYGELKKGSPLSFQKFEHQTVVDTNCSDGLGGLILTDSAAAATALATGVLTTQGIVGYAPQNTAKELKTIMDWGLEMGKRTGVISTESLTGATPMSFSGHAVSRDYSDILMASAAKSGVNFFAGDNTPYSSNYENNGYVVVNSLSQVSQMMNEDKILCNLSVKATNPDGNPAYTLFDELIVTALDYLSQDEDGFVLMAEGAHIDHGGHSNNIAYMVEELLAFDKAVEAAVNWAKERDDTVILVTADHETGGLQLKEGITSGNMDDVDSSEKPIYYSWTTTGHTPVNVGLYVTGLDEINFESYSHFNNTKLKNTDIFNICKDLVVYGNLK